MKKIIALITVSTILLLTACSHNQDGVTGAGSSFIYPVISIWAKNYDQYTNIQVNYQAIGSAATDMPLTSAQLAEHKLQQFPMIVGGIVLAINIPGIKNNELVLDGNLLVKIYMGTIQFWDDAELKRLNPTLNLPHQHVITIHRADGSGTTFNFTNYLAKVSPDWQQHIGSDSIVSWPGNGIGANGNAGVASQILQTNYSIGYVEYSYAKQSNMTITRLINHDNKVVTASPASFSAAAAGANWNASDGFYVILTNQPGADTWPIVATTFILVPVDSNKRQQALNFFHWCFATGARAAEQLDYVSIPTLVYQKIVVTF
jgi:phosphate transport system substrate-binding protein